MCFEVGCRVVDFRGLVFRLRNSEVPRKLEAMKQEIPSRTSTTSSTSTTPSRFRATPRATTTRDPSRSEPVNGVSPDLKTRPRSLPLDPNNNTQKVKRSLVLNKLKSSSEDVVVVGSQKSTSRQVVVEQFARPRQRLDPSFRRTEDDQNGVEKKELQEKLSVSENLVKSLQAEIWGLKSQLENLQSLNLELVSQNKKFAEDLAAAQAKISTFSTQDQKLDSVGEKSQSKNFKDVQKLIANKLENLGAKKNAIKEGNPIQMSTAPKLHSITKVEAPQMKASASLVSLPPAAPTPPPPPPPPPLPQVPSRASTTRRTPTLVDFYHSLTKNETKRDASGPANHGGMMVNNAHNSIVDEIQNRSAHLLAIRTDVNTKGDFIRSLIEKVHSAAYTDIEDVLKFVDWLDRELSSLADERAVLKHFNWPERKADAMREAAIEYRDLKQLESEVSSYKDDPNIPCETVLKKITSLLDKSERGVHRLIKLRDSTMVSYRDCKIPIDWMLDSGMVRKIKQASMKLPKEYMKRVSMETQSVRTSERESAQEALLLQGVRFAYRAHQFAGGLDSETMCAFEEIRQRLPVHMGGSRPLLTGVASS